MGDAIGVIENVRTFIEKWAAGLAISHYYRTSQHIYSVTLGESVTANDK